MIQILWAIRHLCADWWLVVSPNNNIFEMNVRADADITPALVRTIEWRRIGQGEEEEKGIFYYYNPPFEAPQTIYI